MRQLTAVLGVLSGLVLVGADLVLVVVAAHQNAGQQFPGRSLFVAIYLALFSFISFTGAVLIWRQSPAGPPLLAAMGLNLTLLGFLAIFSIGVLLLLAALLMLAAAFLGAKPQLRPALALTLAGALLLGAGFYLSQ